MARKSTKITDEDFAKMEKVEVDVNKYSFNNIYFYLSFNLRVCLLTLIVIVIGFLVYSCFDVSFSDATTVVSKYKEEGNINNDVIMFPNELIDNGSLELGNSYVSDNIDDLSLDFNYKLDFNKDVKYDYSYNIVGRIDIIDDNNEIKAFRDLPLLKDIIGSQSGSEFIIKQDRDIDYDFYNNLAKSFYDDIKASSSEDINCTGNLKIIMNIKLDVFDDAFDNINSVEKKLEIDIPLLSNNVVIDDSKVNEEYVFENKKDAKLVNANSLFLGIILLIVETLIVLISIAYIYKMLPKKSRYVTLRDSLLKDYNKYIVNSKKINDFDGYKIISCTSFKELMDAQKLLNKPIIYFELIKNQKSIFYLVDGDDCYQFILKECDVDYK